MKYPTIAAAISIFLMDVSTAAAIQISNPFNVASFGAGYGAANGLTWGIFVDTAGNGLGPIHMWKIL